VHLWGRETWRGTACPVSVALGDAAVRLALTTHGPYRKGHLYTPGCFGDQPAWWAEAMAVIEGMTPEPLEDGLT